MTTLQPPYSQADLAAQLRDLGVQPGATVMVHTALSRLGYVIGGEAAVVGALVQAVGPEGTLVMPAQSWQLCDPAYLDLPDVPAEWHGAIREGLPAYDPQRTPTRTMGAVAELFRTWPGVRRSAHPQRSVAALGPLAESLTAVHDLEDASGERSPMRALYDARGQVLLLGVGFDKCTALHLAEVRASYPKRYVPNGGPVLRDGARVWETWEELWLEDGDFADLGEAYLAQHPTAKQGPVGQATAVLVDVRSLVDFAVEWFTATRGVMPVAAP